MGAPTERVAQLMHRQVESCRATGSALYARLLQHVGEDVARCGPAWAVLQERADDDEDSGLALRLMGAVHRLVLLGDAPELAAFYPTAGGTEAPEEAWPAFRRVLEARAPWLRTEVRRPVQTNEVGRCAALVGGFLAVARATGLPLRVLEIGASAGLNLRWDAYRYEARGATWGDPASPVRLCGFNTQHIPPFDARAEVVERAGCDRHPLDAATPEDRLTLTSFVWPDQPARVRLLRAALEVAARSPVTVDRADAGEWAARRLAERAGGRATVLFHSIVLQYLTAVARRDLEGSIRKCGEKATADAPLAWLRMEPAGDHAEVRLTTWPGARERVVARSGFHGTGVQWLGA